MSPSWSDPSVKGGIASGERCPSTSPDFASARCVREEGHKGSHRHTSAADGRSVTWGSPAWDSPEPPRLEKDDGFTVRGVAYGSDPADGHPHQWIRGEYGDFCLLCRLSWPDAMRGFGSNVAPPKQTRR